MIINIKIKTNECYLLGIVGWSLIKLPFQEQLQYTLVILISTLIQKVNVTLFPYRNRVLK